MSLLGGVVPFLRVVSFQWLWNCSNERKSEAFKKYANWKNIDVSTENCTGRYSCWNEMFYFLIRFYYLYFLHNIFFAFIRHPNTDPKHLIVDLSLKYTGSNKKLFSYWYYLGPVSQVCVYRIISEIIASNIHTTQITFLYLQISF